MIRENQDIGKKNRNDPVKRDIGKKNRNDPGNRDIGKKDGKP